MQSFRIIGDKPLHGVISVNGSKNAALPIMAAAVLAESPVVLENVPYISDTQKLVAILRQIQVKVEYLDPHTLRIDGSNLENKPVDTPEVREMRASYYLLGSLLGRFKQAEVVMPGGCDFGTRPIDQHIKAFKALGADVEAASSVVMKAECLQGTKIFLDVVSVGATINAMLAAVKAEGVTIIENAAKEPHVVDTASFLNSMGAKVKGAGTDVIRITGVAHLHGSNYCIIPDQIEAGTYMMAAAATHGNVVINNIIPRHMDCISAKLREMGIRVEDGEESIRVDARDVSFSPIKVKTAVYPGFPTDMQAQIVTILALTPGNSTVVETVYEHRYRYVDELCRFGAQITVDGRMACINGVEEFIGCDVTATDLRAGAAMVIAGLAAKGITNIFNIGLIDRGYEDLVNKLISLGASIERVDTEEEKEVKISVI